MPSASSCSAARTTSSTLRLWPRWITSAPCDWMMRRMMLMAASWPSNRLAAVTKRSGVVSALGSLTGIREAGELMRCARSRWPSNRLIVTRTVPRAAARQPATCCAKAPHSIHVVDRNGRRHRALHVVSAGDQPHTQQHAESGREVVFDRGGIAECVDAADARAHGCRRQPARILVTSQTNGIVVAVEHIERQYPAPRQAVFERGVDGIPRAERGAAVEIGAGAEHAGTVD